MTGRWVWQFVLIVVLVPSAIRTGGQDVAPVPLQAGEFTVELNGLRLWYKVAGTGPVCILPTPAWGPSSDLYFRTLQPFEKTFTLVYLDSRGTGRSQRAATDQEYTWERLVADLDALRAHLKQERIWLLGHSEGGVQVLHYACAHPERVSGLILLTTPAAGDAGYRRDLEERIQRRKDQPWFAEAMKALGTSPQTDNEMVALIKKFMPLYWSDPAKIARHADDFAATTMSVRARTGQSASRRFPFDLTKQLQRVSAPALLVAGDDDCFCSPIASRRLHLSLPNSKLLQLERAGHFPWLEQPEAFWEQVPAFLEALRRSR